MMTAYILRLLILLPLVAGMAFGALWLWRRVQPGMSFGPRDRAVKVVDAVPMGAMGRLAVVEFSGKRYLVGVSRGRMDLIAEGDIPEGAGDGPR
ncbi:flagellar biosynthetic protein FliO [Sphingomonas sp. KC8]|uniref:flagellar biosynthetic protein FliO n=1 Tax=Sphingomonas sp. KC8 TaxID=1030157 RepID=UPI0002488AD9|nr:flagellar biosynthetic protein FliO [Sphingomonas sp. KC8]ARS27715.1 flagellar biogenesis protein FliO [Sphingomonas sp. KC8]